MPQAASARLALVAPTSGDAVNIWPGQMQAIRDRLEAVAAMYRTGVAADRPSAASANVGLFYIATDTAAVSVSTGTSWVTLNPSTSLSLSQNDANALQLTGAAGGMTLGGDSTLYRRTTRQLGSNSGLVAGVGTASTADSFATLPTGNTNHPWAVTGSGRVRWSDGSAPFDIELARDGVGILSLTGEFRSSGRYITGLGTATEVRIGQGIAGFYFGSANDTNLYRSAADVLRTDDGLEVGANLNLTGAAGLIVARSKSSASSPILLSSASGNTSDRFELRADGTHLWGPGNAALDVNLFRGGADVLETQDGFKAAGLIYAGNAAGNQIIIGYAGGVGFLAGVTFGDAQDTNLYRSAANTLKTDDHLGVGTDPSTQNGSVARILAFGDSSNANVVLNAKAGASSVGSGPIIESTFTAQTSGTTRGPMITMHRSDTSLSALSAYIGFWTVNAGTLVEGMRLQPSGVLTVGSAALPVSAGVETLRELRGSVNGDGTIARGSGFTITKLSGNGHYRITFSTAFTDVPSVVVNSRPGGDSSSAWIINAEAAGSVDIQNAQLTNNPFNFIAIGPR